MKRNKIFIEVCELSGQPFTVVVSVGHRTAGKTRELAGDGTTMGHPRRTGVRSDRRSDETRTVQSKASWGREKTQQNVRSSRSKPI